MDCLVAPAGLECVTIAPDGGSVVFIDRGGRLGMYSWETSCESPLPWIAANARCVAWSPDGRRLATGHEDDTLRSWSLATRGELLRLDGAKDVESIAIAHSGDLIASVDSSGQVKLWSLETRSRLAMPHNPRSARSVAFAPDDKHLVSTHADGLVRVFDLERRPFSEVARLEGHSGPATCASFSPDGRLLATGGHDGTIRLWALGPAGWHATACYYARGDEWLALDADGRFREGSSEGLLSYGHGLCVYPLREVRELFLRRRGDATVVGSHHDGKTLVRPRGEDGHEPGPR
jgi:Tol biopolymer transport system component